MIVYFADRFLNILGKASTGLPKGYRIINDVKTEDVDSGVSTFEFDLKYKEDTLSEARNMVYPGNYVMRSYDDLDEIIYVFLTIFLYLLKCPQSLILSALRAFCFCGKPHISRSIFLYFRYQAWLKSW